MLASLGNPAFSSTASLPLGAPPHRKMPRRRWVSPLAKKPSETPRAAGGPFFLLRASKPLLAKAAIAVFGLGFVDAGYSGDWSRIGAISKEAEELLKVAAFVVVPLCIFLIYLIPAGEEGNSDGN